MVAVFELVGVAALRFGFGEQCGSLICPIVWRDEAVLVVAADALEAGVRCGRFAFRVVA